MKRPITLNIGVDLPFAVQINVCPGGQPLCIEVDCARNFSKEDLFRLEAHIEIFLEAAMYGMGGGAVVPPRLADSFDLTQLLLGTDRQPTPASVSYKVAGISIDLTYSVVLFHKLYCLAHFFIPISKVTIQIPIENLPSGSVQIVRHAQSDLPDVFDRIPFNYEADLETYSQSLSLTIGFSGQPDESALSILRDARDVWVAQALQGGYISSTNDPENFFLAPDENCFILPNEIQWGLDKIQIDRRGLHALTNFLIAFSNRFLPISYFLIE